MPEITIRAHIELCGSEHYCGTFECAGSIVEFEYDISANIPTVEVLVFRGVELFRELAIVKIRKDGVEVILSNEEYKFFFSLIMNIIVRAGIVREVWEMSGTPTLSVNTETVCDLSLGVLQILRSRFFPSLVPFN